MTKPILYLISNDDISEFDYDQLNNVVRQLLQRGYDVFSPQNYWSTFEADPHICTQEHDGIICKDYPHHIGCPNYFPFPADYSKTNLVFLESWCVPNSSYNRGVVNCIDDDHVEDLSYQPKVVAVVLPSAIDSINWFKEKITVIPPLDDNDEWKNIKNIIIYCKKSFESIKEYAFCKFKHIIVITIEMALTIPFEQWEAYGL